MKCLNCQSESSPCGASMAVVVYQCEECGCRFTERGEVRFIPRRSRPAEEKTLPDAEGWWWKQKSDGAWDAIWVSSSGNYRLVYEIGISGPHPQSRGQFVKAEPPIVATPEPSAAEDAEWLRAMYSLLARSGVCMPIEFANNLGRLSRIAARLERGKEE